MQGQCKDLRERLGTIPKDARINQAQSKSHDKAVLGKRFRCCADRTLIVKRTPFGSGGPSLDISFSFSRHCLFTLCALFLQCSVLLKNECSFCAWLLNLKGYPLICIASSCVFLTSYVSPDFRSPDVYSVFLQRCTSVVGPLDHTAFFYLCRDCSFLFKWRSIRSSVICYQRRSE